MDKRMPNQGQPTIGPGATGDVVRRLQRALRRTPDLSFGVDGIFGPQLEAAVRLFQEDTGLAVDGIVDPQTWNALPDGGPMPVLRAESSGAVVQSLQTLLTNGAIGGWGTTPQGIDGIFGPHTKASVEAFQARMACPWTRSSATRPGRSHCTQRAQPWKVQLA
jgi:peptidoglycan hydrolase-like protein with peptidoglycan-binding domain